MPPADPWYGEIVSSVLININLNLVDFIVFVLSYVNTALHLCQQNRLFLIGNYEVLIGVKFHSRKTDGEREVILQRKDIVFKE